MTYFQHIFDFSYFSIFRPCRGLFSSWGKGPLRDWQGKLLLELLGSRSMAQHLPKHSHMEEPEGMPGKIRKIQKHAKSINLVASLMPPTPWKASSQSFLGVCFPKLCYVCGARLGPFGKTFEAWRYFIWCGRKSGLGMGMG